MNEYIIFWGTGKIGYEILELWKRHSVCPDYYCDNNEQKSGNNIEGIEIISPQQLYRLKHVTIFITCNAFKAVKKQIDSMRLRDAKVIDGSSVYSNEMMRFLYHRDIFRRKTKKKEINEKKVIFDFNYGTTLGGVQRWSYTATNVLKKFGVLGEYLMPDNVPHECKDNSAEIRIAGRNAFTDFDGYFDSYVNSIVESGAGIIICNFPREIFYAAVLVKQLYNPILKIIAVVHNDEDIYYNAYSELQEWIDKCFINNTVMKEKLLFRGFSEKKLVFMQWKMSSVTAGKRTYSFGNNALRIGYAGRIEIHQKRVDFILDVAESLKKDRIKYRLEMAGEGGCVEYLLEEIKKRKLEDTVFYLGLLSHEKIYDFWQRQDIFLSCSDYEGRCISQYEAMLNGAVPVVTNTSGTNDDIENGINGFIAPIGGTEKIAEYIEYLNEHRDLLEKMGKTNADVVRNKNKQADEESFWREVFCEII